MVRYPNCPHCGNASTAMSVVDVEIGGILLKGIQCNNCNSFIAFYKDYDEQLVKINNTIEELEGEIDN